MIREQNSHCKNLFSTYIDYVLKWTYQTKPADLLVPQLLNRNPLILLQLLSFCLQVIDSQAVSKILIFYFKDREVHSIIKLLNFQEL